MAKKDARNTKGRIVDAAWSLFYEKGYEGTTIEEIVERSETSKGSFYHYFDSKDALLSSFTYSNKCSPICWPLVFASTHKSSIKSDVNGIIFSENGDHI